MSSELFENYETEFSNILTKVSTKINSQIPNFSGEQRKAAVRTASKDIERAEDLLREMEIETRSAPPTYRTKMSTRLRGYQTELQKMKRDLMTAETGGGAAAKTELLGGPVVDTYESRQANQRTRLLNDNDALNRTSDRISNAQRIGEESEQIGTAILSELGDQRQTIIRTGAKVSSTDANLGKSKRILNSMARRVITNKLIMYTIIFLLVAILIIVLLLKLHVIGK